MDLLLENTYLSVSVAFGCDVADPFVASRIPFPSQAGKILVQNVILWDDLGLATQGQYLEESETEEVGRAEAIELLVQRIVDGAQSNW